ncbi:MULTISPECIES: hypothetical protein [Rhizobium]|uniref:Uncharacterized protein n=1 Tax=Rhizobium aouanii TaxID=3118145 RepID=A0ABU8CIX5_9HYPH|nr:hypothetical protein [Rhizobium acaciae]MCW1410708.1 hypothetical protein [Rhizobium acaciae]MCW1742993.1 hypothetical protein [Rhizobium acaciae]MCW1750189.1 hypothetical protein [Rhizobium acaciae]
MLQPDRRDATCQRQNFPRRFRVSPRTKIRPPATSSTSFRLFECVAPYPSAVSPRDDRKSKGETSCNSSLNSSPPPVAGPHALGGVICHFFRKGKLGLKLAIKIPFFVEIEASFETDWDHRT